MRYIVAKTWEDRFACRYQGKFFSTKELIESGIGDEYAGHVQFDEELVEKMQEVDTYEVFQDGSLSSCDLNFEPGGIYIPVTFEKDNSDDVNSGIWKINDKFPIVDTTYEGEFRLYGVYEKPEFEEGSTYRFYCTVVSPLGEEGRELFIRKTKTCSDFPGRYENLIDTNKKCLVSDFASMSAVRGKIVDESRTAMEENIGLISVDGVYCDVLHTGLVVKRHKLDTLTRERLYSSEFVGWGINSWSCIASGTFKTTKNGQIYAVLEKKVESGKYRYIDGYFPLNTNNADICEYLEKEWKMYF